MQDHFNTTEVFLNREERLGIIKELLEKVINCVSNPNEENVVNESLEELILHIEAAGPDLKLNVREHTILSLIKSRRGASVEAIAYWCAQLLGSISNESRFPVSWKECPDFAKREFLGQLTGSLDRVIKKKNMRDIFDLEKLISGFTCHEDYDIDPEVSKLCFNVQVCIRDVLVYGYEVSTVRLEVQRNIAIMMRSKLKVALS